MVHSLYVHFSDLNYLGNAEPLLCNVQNIFLKPKNMVYTQASQPLISLLYSA